MSWLLRVAAVALLTVLTDVILPSGQINKYVKGMMAILLLIVLVSPLVALVRQDADLFDLLNLDIAGYESDQAYIDMIDEERATLPVTQVYPAVRDVQVYRDLVVVYVEGEEPQGLAAYIAARYGVTLEEVKIYAT